MKRMMLIGPSQCGKTSLTQRLRGEALCYRKTQSISWLPETIDTPGEYIENRCLYSALLTSASDADVIALVLNADASWSPFSPGFTAAMNRPAVGIISKADCATTAQLSQSERWLKEAGAGQIFVTSALTGAGIEQLAAFLNPKESPCHAS